MEKHEVVIVGAGPAGLKAGELLAKANKDVLIIERKREKDIGDKPCAGGLFPHSIKYFPEDILENVINSVTIYIGEKRIKIDIGKPLIGLISRLDIGQYQLKLAKENGAQIMANTRVKGLEKKENQVILQNEERISYQWLIAADGSNSIIRRNLGFNSKQVVQCIEFRYPGSFDELEAYFDLVKYGLTYYWIFPHRNYASVGTGTLPFLMSIKEMKEKFNEWANEKGIDLSNAKRRGAPIYLAYHGFKHSNIYLTGDAASFVFPVTCEGIYQAIRSGEIAAKSIIEPTWNYKTELRDLLRHHKYGIIYLPWVSAFPNISKKLIKEYGPEYMKYLSGVASLVGSLEITKKEISKRLYRSVKD
jgi:geranylgeranyl reductase